eukprot:scaffold24574_cov157-Cylindrotheca_fusiformis.AAC.2
MVGWVASSLRFFCGTLWGEHEMAYSWNDSNWSPPECQQQCILVDTLEGRKAATKSNPGGGRQGNITAPRCAMWHADQNNGVKYRLIRLSWGAWVSCIVLCQENKRRFITMWGKLVKLHNEKWKEHKNLEDLSLPTVVAADMPNLKWLCIYRNVSTTMSKQLLAVSREEY